MHCRAHLVGGTGPAGVATGKGCSRAASAKEALPAAHSMQRRNGATVQADYKDKDCQLNDGDDTFACDALFYGLEWYGRPY